MLQPATSRVLWRAVMGLVGASVLFVALMAFAHTERGRPLLTMMFGAGPPEQAKRESGGACPMGFSSTQSTPEEKEVARKRGAEKLRGQNPSSARPALGFELAKTTRADVEAWAAKHSIACKKPKVGADLDCSNVPPEALPEGQLDLTAAAVWFRFDPQDRVVGVETVRYTTDLQQGSSNFAGLLQGLTAKLGPPSNTFGEPTAEYLSRGLLSQARASFAFTDYRADASATQINQGKYMISEKYKSLN